MAPAHRIAHASKVNAVCCAARIAFDVYTTSEHTHSIIYIYIYISEVGSPSRLRGYLKIVIFAARARAINIDEGVFVLWCWKRLGYIWHSAEQNHFETQVY